MRSIKLVVLLLIPAVATATGNRAVLETNYEIEAGYQNKSVGDEYTVDGRLTMPLLRFGGVSLLGGYERLEGDSGVLDSDTYSVGGELFMRDYDIGRLGAQVLYLNQSFDHPNNVVSFNDNSTAKVYSATGEYYYRKFTLSGSRTYIDFDHVDNVESWGLGGLFYVTDNIRLGIAGDYANDKTIYAFRAALQPALFGNSAEVSVGYADVGNGDHTYSVSLAYYFDKRPALIDRDRKLR